MADRKLIIWDFDGVICDSLIECVTVTKVAVHRIHYPSEDITDQNLYEICRSDEVMVMYEQLRHLRPFVVKGQDYLWQYFNLDAFAAVPTSMDAYRAIFDRIFDADRDRAYEQAFYAARKLIQSIMQKQYFGLFRPYAGALYAFRTSLARNRSYVCTARDQQGVQLLFGDNAIEFPRDRIYAKDFRGLRENLGLGKSEQILEILDREGGRHQPFVIVEDQVKAPADLRGSCPNMEVIFAAYGYGLMQDWLDAGLTRLRTAIRPDHLVHNIY